MYDYNPYMNLYQGESLVRVNGIDGARAYQMRPNSTVALFDANDDYFFLKQTDGAGFPTIRTFKFEEMFTTQMSETNNFVTREEFDALRKEIEDGKQHIQSADSE